MSFQNEAAKKRRKLAKKLAQHINELELSDREISRATGIDLVTVRGLRQLTPKLETLEKISRYVEDRARQRRLEKLEQTHREASRKRRPASSKRKRAAKTPSA